MSSMLGSLPGAREPRQQSEPTIGAVKSSGEATQKPSDPRGYQLLTANSSGQHETSINKKGYDTDVTSWCWKFPAVLGNPWAKKPPCLMANQQRWIAGKVPIVICGYGSPTKGQIAYKYQSIRASDVLLVSRWPKSIVACHAVRLFHK